MRSGAICVTSVKEVCELMGFVTEGESHPVARVNEQLTLGLDTEEIGFGEARRVVTASVDDPLAGHPLAVRVRDALPVRRACAVSRIAVTAGVSVPEALKGLGMLEMKGIAEQVGDGWRLASAARR